MDYIGNRVAAITFGPDKVIKVVGSNKKVEIWKWTIGVVKI